MIDYGVEPFGGRAEWLMTVPVVPVGQGDQVVGGGPPRIEE